MTLFTSHVILRLILKSVNEASSFILSLLPNLENLSNYNFQI